MNHSRWLRSARTAFLCAVLVAPTAGFAQFTARVVPGAKTALAVESLNPDVAFCGGCLVTASQSGAFVNGGVLNRSDASGTALADYGVLKVLARGSTSGPDAFAETDAMADFSDSFTIDAAGLTGQHGTVRLTLATTSTHDISGQAFGQLSTRLQVNAGGGSQGTWIQAATFDADGSVRSGSSSPGIGAVPYGPTLLADIDFVYGESISFLASLSARVGGRSGASGAPASFAVDASHSAYWGGFLAVLDGSGDEVGTYAVSSGSGTDWSRSFVPPPVSPVPEPETCALLLAGLGAVRFVASRRRDQTSKKTVSPSPCRLMSKR